MALVTTQEARYQAIAAAIRAKNGQSSRYTPSQMAEAIAALPLGAKTVTVTLVPGSGAFTFQSATAYLEDAGGPSQSFPASGGKIPVTGLTPGRWTFSVTCLIGGSPGTRVAQTTIPFASPVDQTVTVT